MSPPEVHSTLVIKASISPCIAYTYKQARLTEDSMLLGNHNRGLWRVTGSSPALKPDPQDPKKGHIQEEGAEAVICEKRYKNQTPTKLQAGHVQYNSLTVHVTQTQDDVREAGRVALQMLASSLNPTSTA